MKNNLLIISHEPLTPSLKKMYCIDELKNDFNVKFLSLRRFFYNEKKFYEDELTDEFKDFSNIFSFASYIKKFDKKNTFIFLDNSSNHLSVIFIDFILRKHKICYFILYNNSLSNKFFIKKKSFLEKIFYYLNIKNLKRLIIRKLRIKEYYIIFSSGRNKTLFKAKQHIFINNTLYTNKNYSKSKDNYVVFIDQGFPSHPDLLNNYNYKVNKSCEIKVINNYNRFFTYIEKKYNTKVIIAKHPKSSIKNKLFNKRDIYVNKTDELIHNSRFVICHFSYINNIAVLYYKPIILIYDDIIKNLPNDPYWHMNEFSKTLDLRLINIQKSKYHYINLKINKKKYDNYINKYLIINKKESNSEIVKNALLN